MPLHGHDHITQPGSNLTHSIDALASPPLYSEAEETANQIPAPPLSSSLSHRQAENLQRAPTPLEAAPSGHGGIAGAAASQAVPSYQASATGGDRTVLGGPWIYSSDPSAQGDADTGSSATGRHARARPPQQDDCFFDIAPASDATSFQVGYLGLEGFQAWVKGEVLLKLAGSTDENGAAAPPDASRAGKRSDFYKCIIELRAVESIDTAATTTSDEDGAAEVELFYSSLTLWDATAATSSTAPPTELPTTMPFSFPLTQDLPHCLHLPKSRLAYSLRATLHSSNTIATPSMVKEVPVHLTRYSAPDPLPSLSLTTSAFSLEPHVWQTSTPTEVYVELERTLYRRSEPMNFRVLIPALSDRRLMTEKSLQLRAVEADLVRIITVLAPSSSTAQCESALKSKEKGKNLEEDSPRLRNSVVGENEEHGQDVPSYTAAMEHQEPAEGEAGPSYQSSAQHTITASSSASSMPLGSVLAHNEHDCDNCAPGQVRPERYETLLAHSGKLCRFSTHRAVNLRLTLHPPFSAPNMPHPHPDHDAFAVAARSAAMYVRPGSAVVSSSSHLRQAHTTLGNDSEPDRDGQDGLREIGPAGSNRLRSYAGPASVELAVPGSLAGGSGCESISQETLLHRVQFEVRVRIALDGGPAGRRDVRFVREVRVLPGAAGEVVGDLPPSSSAAPTASTNVPTDGAEASGGGSNGSSQATSRQAAGVSEKKSVSGSSGKRPLAAGGPFVNFNDEEEYDGYEDVLQDLDSDELQLVEGEVADSSLGSVASVPYLAAAAAAAAAAAGSSAAGILRNASATDVSRFGPHPNAVTRSADSMDTEPPPSMQQAEHDLQVEEVEVEGVGFAVPRRRVGGTGHGIDAADETIPGFYESFPPPPPLSPAEESRYSYANLHTRHPSDDIPPPPSPPPPAPDMQPPALATSPQGQTHAESGSAQEHVGRMDGTNDRDAHFPAPPPLPSATTLSARTGPARPLTGPESTQHEPPPSYLAADVTTNHHQDRPPSFHAGSGEAPHSIRPLVVEARTESARPLASTASPTRPGLPSPLSRRRVPAQFADEPPPPGIEEPDPLRRSPSHENDEEASENAHRLLSALPPAYVQPPTTHAAVLPAFQGPPSYSLR
ncbi:hypothetical protein OC861_004003 [Tilletia horrida]|nr:hypothetical protein OC861_004003 [Tilletia horrida]